MRSNFILRPVLLASLAILLLIVSFGWAQDIPDFTFIHGSDSHLPDSMSSTQSVISEIANLGEINLLPYKVTVPAPSFVIVTGDLTEFGPFQGGLDAYLNCWKNVKIPIYNQSGNHDGTWYCIRRALRRWHGSHCYSFDFNDCHFIGLDTSTPQDPRPTITTEQLLWLKEDFKKVKPTTPVFLFFHHPLYGSEFASEFECDRLVDILRPYNVVLMMAGHSHGHVLANAVGYDLVTGGSFLKPDPGFSIVSVKDGILRVAYKKAGEKDATIPILQKPLSIKSTYPEIKILEPQEGKVYAGDSVPVIVTITGNTSRINVATYKVDGEVVGDFMLEMEQYKDSLDIRQLQPGAHYLKVTFTDENGSTFQKSVSFYTESSSGAKAIWRAFAGGSCKGAPAITNDAVYVGATDGKLYAFRRSDGKLLWTFKTGGEILCQPLVVNDTVYFGSGDAKFYAVGIDGKLKWSYNAGGPIYSSPVLAGDLIIFGCNDSKLYALNSSGKLVWANDDAAYTIESKPFVDGDTVYFGAWDTYVYAVDVKTGATKWKCVGYGSATKPAARYYSPADCGPVVSNGKVFIADRNMSLSIIDAASGKMLDHRDNCAGVGLSEDGQHVYLRGDSNNVTKIDLEGKDVWSVNAGVRFMPAAPTERDGVVYVCTNTGTLKALSASDGSLLWTYQVTPRLFVMSSVEAKDGVAFVTGMDGSITAISGGSTIAN
ncbi:MAG: PQQ-binding-like beta-propeller repeat protein [Armatimonadetes bacterium]|nr:PQQ-binding-like beta-propeller repeat protein [Armatimonadota bacterium]